MPTYDASISRDESSDPLVPTPVSAEIIQQLPQSSAVLTRARRVTMSSKTSRQPVLSVLPTAYFVSGDTGLKQTGTQDWENLELVAEELAVIVPVPEAYLSDSQVPIWSEVQPRIAEAFGLAIDAACLFGTNLPATWSDDLLTTIIAGDNEVTEGDNDDLAADVAEVAKLIAEDGFTVNGFISSPGLRWRLIGMRTADGIPIYAPPAGDQPGTLFGYPLNEVLNGGWDSTEATLFAGDWSKAIVGLRQDMNFKVFDQGVITDAQGAVVLNLMQQDAVAIRATMRLAWAVANPITPLNSNDTTRFAFGALRPAGAPSS